jgi:hypothetical protein
MFSSMPCHLSRRPGRVGTFLAGPPLRGVGAVVNQAEVQCGLALRLCAAGVSLPDIILQRVRARGGAKLVSAAREGKLFVFVSMCGSTVRRPGI